MAALFKAIGSLIPTVVKLIGDNNDTTLTPDALAVSNKMLTKLQAGSAVVGSLSSDADVVGACTAIQAAQPIPASSTAAASTVNMTSGIIGDAAGAIGKQVITDTKATLASGQVPAPVAGTPSVSITTPTGQMMASVQPTAAVPICRNQAQSVTDEAQAIEPSVTAAFAQSPAWASNLCVQQVNNMKVAHTMPSSHSGTRRAPRGVGQPTTLGLVTPEMQVWLASRYRTKGGAIPDKTALSFTTQIGAVTTANAAISDNGMRMYTVTMAAASTAGQLQTLNSYTSLQAPSSTRCLTSFSSVMNAADAAAAYAAAFVTPTWLGPGATGASGISPLYWVTSDIQQQNIVDSFCRVNIRANLYMDFGGAVAYMAMLAKEYINGVPQPGGVVHLAPIVQGSISGGVLGPASITFGMDLRSSASGTAWGLAVYFYTNAVVAMSGSTATNSLAGTGDVVLTLEADRARNETREYVGQPLMYQFAYRPTIDSIAYGTYAGAAKAVVRDPSTASAVVGIAGQDEIFSAIKLAAANPDIGSVELLANLAKISGDIYVTMDQVHQMWMYAFPDDSQTRPRALLALLKTLNLVTWGDAAKIRSTFIAAAQIHMKFVFGLIFNKAAYWNAVCDILVQNVAGINASTLGQVMVMSMAPYIVSDATVVTIANTLQAYVNGVVVAARLGHAPASTAVQLAAGTPDS